jgi:hypothetical protein
MIKHKKPGASPAFAVFTLSLRANPTQLLREFITMKQLAIDGNSNHNRA